MVKIKANGKWLVLPDGFNPPVERHNSALHPGEILGVFSFNLSLPVKGNEVALSFAYSLENGTDQYIIDNAEMWQQGRCDYGKLILHATEMDKTDGDFQADFVGSGFDIDIHQVKLPMLTLPTYSLGETTAEILAAAKAACEAESHPFRFPVFRNDAFYREEENPFLFLDEDGSKRDPFEVYINRFDPAAEEFPENEIDLAYYLANPGSSPRKNLTTLVPWFHLLEVVKAVVDTLGYKAAGSLFSDEEAAKILLTSNFSLDKTLPKSNYSRVGVWDSIFMLSQYAQGVNPGFWDIENEWRLLDTSDEVSGYFEDYDNRFSASTRIYTVSGNAGVFIRAHIRFAHGHLGVGYSFRLHCRVLKWTGAAWGFVQADYRTFSKTAYGAQNFNATFMFNITDTEVSSDDQIRVEFSDLEGIGVTITQEPIHPVHYVDLEFIDIESSLMGIDVIEGAVNMANHVPNWSVSTFLIEVKDLFCLDVDINHNSKIIELNFAAEQLRKSATAIKPDVEYKKLFRKPAGLKFTQSREKVYEGTGLGAEDFTAPDWHSFVFRYGDVRFDPRVHKFFVLEYEEGETQPIRKWVEYGEKDGDVSVGSTIENVQEISSGFVPAEMIHVVGYIDEDKKIVIPKLDEYGSKPSLNIVGNDSTPGIAIWHGMQPDSDDDLYPLASLVQFNYEGDEVGELALTWSGEKGMHKRWWEKWSKFLVNNSEIEVLNMLSKNDMDKIFANKKVSWMGQSFIIAETNEQPTQENVIATLILKRIEPARN